MWKVLIADDEPKIRHGLEMTLQGLELDLMVCAQARNGAEALTLAEETRPDLILADICMPKLNGLKFLRGLKDLDLSCRVVIISGFNEFEYAREAIELGVTGYLIKPIDDKELKSVLKQAIEELEKERQSSQLLRLLRRQIGKYEGQLKSSLFSGWLEGTLDPAELKEQQTLLGIRLDEEYTILMVSMQDVTLQSDDGLPVTRDLYQDLLQETLSEALVNCDTVSVFANRYQDQVAIIRGDTPDSAAMHNEIRQKMELSVGGRCFVQICSGRGEKLVSGYQEMCGSARTVLECRPIVRKARDYINTHFADHSLCLTLVADAIGCNSSYLSRIMKQELGMTFTEFLTSVRISQSIQMMRMSELSLQQIAEMSGYSNQHYFSVAFKNVQGISPSEYRRNIKS